MDTLSVRGRRIRIGVTLAIAGLLLYGTLWGQDDLFPFGPFRMYATTDKLNAPVFDTRFELVDTTGTTVELTEVNTGIRRAEIEGQLTRIEQDPSLLRVIDEAYVSLNPHAPAPVEIQVIVRWHQLKNGLDTGVYTDQTVATWNVPAGQK